MGQQNGIDIHLKKLWKTESTLREEIDSIFESQTKAMPNKRRAKKLNNDLIEIVQHRNDHESRLDPSSFAAKTISNLLNDETAPAQINDINALNLTPSLSEYLSLRQSIDEIRTDLVECVEKRETANLALSYCKCKLCAIETTEIVTQQSLNINLLKSELIKFG